MVTGETVHVSAGPVRDYSGTTEIRCRVRKAGGERRAGSPLRPNLVIEPIRQVVAAARLGLAAKSFAASGSVSD
jgi:hypothetical protein